MMRNSAPYASTLRNRYPHVRSESRHRPKYVGHRPIKPPSKGPTTHPTIAPIAESRPVSAFASGILPPVILSAQSGAHCTEPHVPIRAIDAKAIARTVVLIRPCEKISFRGRDALTVTD